MTFGSAGAYAVAQGQVLEARTGESFDLRGAKLHGLHNHHNAAAAIAAARALDVAPAAVRAGLERFQPLAHRMALAGEIDGVRFYDDSKGTNVGAAVTALCGLTENQGLDGDEMVPMPFTAFEGPDGYQMQVDQLAP